jgi:phosphoribosyl 1,2-cyclic phosphodiesterase
MVRPIGAFAIQASRRTAGRGLDPGREQGWVTHSGRYRTDLRQQLLANDIHRLDAVFWTHDHADHCHGIDDLRPLRYGRGGPIAGYAVDETMRRLRNRFSYVFSGQHGYHTLVEIEGWTG